MKKSRICLFIILILAVSCTKSRFATTTRHYHDGKVTYANHYSYEKVNLKLHKVKHTATRTRDASAKTAGNQVDNPEKINRMNLIASTDKNYLILTTLENMMSQYAPGHYPEFRNVKEVKTSRHHRGAFTKEIPAVAFKKNLQSDSTIVKKQDTIKGNATGISKTDNRKTEPLGLVGFILSFLGIIPLIGIPFAVIAIIFGARSLKKTIKNPEKYKGKGFAIASMAIGCAMIVMNIFYIVSTVNSVANTPAPTIDTSSTNCRF